jgi:hypothetical protein
MVELRVRLHVVGRATAAGDRGDWGRYYWTAWALVPVRLAPSAIGAVPEQWQTAGSRTSIVDRKSARRAATPAHAMLNYGYAILEAEAILACHAVGLDPALGLMHTDTRYRGSFATDLMEPARPIVDGLVLELLTARELERGDVVVTREGVCRLGPALAGQLATSASQLRSRLAPDVGHVRSGLLAGRAGGPTGSAPTAPTTASSTDANSATAGSHPRSPAARRRTGPVSGATSASPSAPSPGSTKSIGCSSATAAVPRSTKPSSPSAAASSGTDDCRTHSERSATTAYSR